MRQFHLIGIQLIFCFIISGCSYFGSTDESSSPEAGQPQTAIEKPAQQVQEPTPETPEVTEAQEMPPQLFAEGSFEDPKRCSNCHRDIYNEWSQSMHANAWQNKWYQPDFLLAHAETDGATDLLCGACHAPIAARTGQLPPADGSKFDATANRGISCDFCHTVTSLGPMFNMGHISEPGMAKIGPRGDGRSLYHDIKTTGIHSKADFCGSCHMVIHPATGVHIIDTWQDWKNGPYAEEGTTCQDCHMTPTPGVEKTPGRAALLGKWRDNMPFHGFVGGSSYVQGQLGNNEQAKRSRDYLRSAAEMKLSEKISDDGRLELTVEVHNVGAGHKIPTGTTYIRIMWLQVEVTDAAGNLVYSSGQIDENNHVDPNAAFFRLQFRDAEGNLTGKSWRAHSIGYDRRIPAKGMDSETYQIPLPGNGEYQVTSRLMYRSFTQKSLDEVYQRTGRKLPPVESVEMARAVTKVML